MVRKDNPRQKRHLRIRQKICGNSVRPRLAVFKSNQYIYAQIIDDTKGGTLVSASSLDSPVKELKQHKGNIATAKEVGGLLARRAQEKGIKKIVFDRGGYLYHGRVKALADAAREAGLEF